MEEGPRFKLFTMILIVIALVASLYAPTQTLKLEQKFFGGTASPHNTGYMGTSELVTLLKGLGCEVVIAENEQDFINALSEGGLGIIIAPDRPVPADLSSKLLDLFKEGRASFLIADENTTSNYLIMTLTPGLVIDGRAVFSVNKEKLAYSPFPSALMATKLNETLTNPVLTLVDVFELRLNWASFIKPVPQGLTPEWVVGHYVIGVTAGVIDFNNNGRLDAEDLKFESIATQGKGHMYEDVAVEAVSRSGSKVLIFSDSFPFTNQALTPQDSVYRAYVTQLFRNLVKADRVVICDFLYRTGVKAAGIPYHPAMLLYFAASAFKLLDSVITSAVSTNSFLAVTESIAIILLLTYLISKGLGFGNYRTVEPSPVEEVDIIAETEVRRAVLTGEAVKKPKEAVKGLWDVLNYVLRQLYGFGVEDVLRDEHLLKGFSEALNTDPEALKSRLSWLVKVSRKASGKAHLPVIISWKRALRKYAELTEQVLEPLGYTIMRRGGLRGVESVIH
ncbi:MAG: hypothetical protein J7L55_05820 [Desulfurococcales archaeon]|nr:hypothetical protein [Desulfurococcales archaeon]